VAWPNIPQRVTRDPQRLSEEHRYDVPATVIACEYPTAMLRQWMAQGHRGTRSGHPRERRPRL